MLITLVLMFAIVKRFLWAFIRNFAPYNETHNVGFIKKYINYDFYSLQTNTPAGFNSFSPT